VLFPPTPPGPGLGLFPEPPPPEPPVAPLKNELVTAKLPAPPPPPIAVNVPKTLFPPLGAT
jgi:hypothetical protein